MFCYTMMVNLHSLISASKGKAYWQLIRGDRPVGMLLLLWPTL